MGDEADRIIEQMYNGDDDWGADGDSFDSYDCIVEAETDKAWLLHLDGYTKGVPEWFPKSRCDLTITSTVTPLSAGKPRGTVDIPDWLMGSKGLL